MKKIKAVVLAAGKGTRLATEGCDLPKVMREALGRPLLHYVLEALDFIDDRDTIIVVGYKREHVTARFKDYPFAVQREQLGTGHAVMAARDALAGHDGSVLVCYGDMPLITRDTYRRLIDEHFSENFDCTILSSASDLGLPFGRIVRGTDGNFLKIVEDKDCTDAERKINELNSGVYVFKTQPLLASLSGLRNNNSQSEYYLTDVPEIMLGSGLSVGVCKMELGRDIIGVNTAEQLREVESILSDRGL